MKRFLRKQLPAFLLVLVMLVGMMPAAAAATPSLSYTVKAGKTLTIDRDDFKTSYEDNSDSTFRYFSVEDAGKMDSYGVFKANDYDGYSTELDSNDMEDGYFYYKDDHKDDEDSDYDLEDDLVFKADKDAKSGSFTMTLILTDKNEEEDVEVELTIKVTSGSSSDSDDADITFSVDEGDKITLGYKKFKSLYDKKYKDDFYGMYFTDADNLDDCGHFSAVNGKGKTIKLDEDELLDYDTLFYYDEEETYAATDYELASLAFEADDKTDGETVTLEFTLVGYDDNEREGTLVIEIGETDDDDDDDDSDYEIVYEVEEDDEFTVARKDFKELFEEEYKNFSYLEFTDVDNLDDCGELTAEDWDEDKQKFDEDDILDATFFYSADDLDDDDHYYLATLTLVTDDDTDGEVITLDFTMYNDDDDEVDGQLIFEIGDVKSSSKDDDDKDEADIVYEVDPDDDVMFVRKDFKDLFEDEYEDFWYVEFTSADNLDDCGELFAEDYDEEEVDLDEKALKDAVFYYSADDVEDDDQYYLGSLGFTADDDTDGEIVTLEFTMYGEDEDDEMDGILEIHIGDVASTDIAGKGSGDIRYTTTYSNAVQINANHFASFLKAKYPSSSLQYVKITGVPSAGSVYYDYYNTSSYGEKVRLTSSNCSNYKFYFSPGSEKDYALTELSFIPNGFNYCPTISFTAYGSGNKSVSGEILISVTLNKIPDVYGVTPKGTAVKFPATSINSAVNTGTGAGVGSIRLLKLPSASQGSIRLSNGLGADTETLYTYSTSSSYSISGLQFVPSSSFTGNVEIPYVAYNASGNAVGSGIFSLGVVKAVPKFKDVNSATWCYKYVAEMSDAGVIGGYSDGTYRPNNALTYGAALKLIMLAAGYEKQAEPAGNTFGNYLTLAKKDGLVSGNPKLNGPITRLQVAQIAAKAMDLDTSDLSSVKPFTDTSDKYVQALNAAGIVEGYFSNGTSTFKGGNTLTRGHISAIIWRMENYKG